MKTLVGVLVTVGLIVGIIIGIIWFMGSENPYTPAGYVGYLTKGAIFGKASFIGLQDGPVSPGREWLVAVINVSITPFTYTESFLGKESVLAKDNLEIQFQAHVVWRIKKNLAKEFVENFSTLEVKQTPDQVVSVAYKHNIREPFRTAIRDQVQILNGLEVKENFTTIGSRVLEKMRSLTKDTPFEILSIVVGNIQYPPEVSKSVATKLATSQLNEQKDMEILIEGKDAEKRFIQAKGIAKSMAEINQTLTPQYLQHEAIEAQKLMINSPNHTTVYIPVGPMGVPITGTFDTRGK